MTETLEQRIETLERAVTDGDHDLSGLAAEADAVDRLETIESRVDDIDDRVSELEAATQALRGYVGNIRSVNTDVEQRAETALAKVESLEATLDLDEGVVLGEPPSTVDGTVSGDSTGAEPRNESADQQPDNRAHERPRSDVEECASCGRPRPGGAPPDQGLTDGGHDGAVAAGGTSDATGATNHTRVYKTDREGEGDEVFPDAPDRPTGDEGLSGTLQRIRNML